MKKSLAVTLLLIAVASVALPYRFGLGWLLLPGLVLGALALAGIVREHGDGERVDPFLSEHAVKMLVASGLMCILGIAGVMQRCNARPPDRIDEPARDFIRERSKASAAPSPSRLDGP